MRVFVFPTYLRGQQTKMHLLLTSHWELPRSTCSQSNRSRGLLTPSSTRLHHLFQCLPTTSRLPFPTRLKLHEDRRALNLFTVMYPVHSTEPFQSAILDKYSVSVKSASSQWFPTGGHFASQGTSDNVWRHFWSSQVREAEERSDTGI